MILGDALAELTWWREALSLLIGLTLGGLGVWFALRHRRSRERALEAELEAARTELLDYRAQVDAHFARAGELLQAMTSSYRTVYEHLAQGAHTLCQAESRLPNLDLPRVTHQGSEPEVRVPSAAPLPQEPNDPDETRRPER